MSSEIVGKTSETFLSRFPFSDFCLSISPLRVSGFSRDGTQKNFLPVFSTGGKFTLVSDKEGEYRIRVETDP